MKPLAVTVIQSVLHWEDREANLAMFTNKIMSLGADSEIVLLPEMFTTAFSMQPQMFAEQMDGETVNWMRKTAAAKRIILAGSLMIEEGGRYFNRLVWVLPTGELGYYDKRHLFGYAGEDKCYSPGSKRLITMAKGWRLNMQICYDLRFPVWARHQKPVDETFPTDDDNAEYDVLIYVANWPDKRNHAWKTLLQARAIENQCYVIGVNRVGRDGNDNYYSGDSMIVDPMGEVLYTIAHDEAIFTQILDPEKLTTTRRKLPFLKDADKFMITARPIADADQ